MKQNLRAARCAALLTGILLFSGCATQYSLALRYKAQGPPRDTDLALKSSLFSSCIFMDERYNVTDRQRIGTRIVSEERRRPINSVASLPGHAVAAAVKSYLFAAGYSVFGGLPAWDLRESTLEPSWGTFAIGGSIEEFEALSWEDLGVTHYKVKVKLRVVVADVRRKQIIYTTVVDAGSSLRHVYFSQSRMQREVNSALSAAVERIFAVPGIYDALQDALRAQSRPIRG